MLLANKTMKNKTVKKVVEILFLLFVVGGIIFISKSYALFQKQKIGADVTLKVGELNYQLNCSQCTNNKIEIEPNTSKEISIRLISKNPINSKYELYYKIVSKDQLKVQVDGGYIKTSEDFSYGIIKPEEEKNIQLILNNYENQMIEIEIGVKSGLVSNEIVLEEAEYTLKEEDFQKHYVYDYTGNYQTFTAPSDGTYKIELWGAGTDELMDPIIYDENKHRGGYVKGDIILRTEDILYVYVGQKYQFCEEHYSLCGAAWNGEGEGGYFTASWYPARYPSGSGATDIRLVKGNWNDIISLRSRIMVAGGSGFASLGSASAGGLVGYTPSDYNNGTGGTQISGGTSDSEAGGFGYGGKGKITDPENPYKNDATGGGSGYYGGGGGLGGISQPNVNRIGSSGGGSSFISGHPGCIAIQSETDQTPKVTTYSSLEDSYHYSGKVFTNTVMIDGKGYSWTSEIGENIGMPTHDLTSTMVGNNGNGYARITYLGD